MSTHQERPTHSDSMIEFGAIKLPDWVLRVLVHPLLILSVHGTLAVLTFNRLWGHAHWWEPILGIVIGAISVSLAEYVIHRFLFHSRNGKLAAVRIHIRHHAAPGDAAFGTVPLPGSLLMLAAISSPWLLLGEFYWSAVFGLVVGYLWHESTHYLAHKDWFLTARGRHLHELHRTHHFKNPRANFGFITLFWDRVFGTFDAGREPR